MAASLPLSGAKGTPNAYGSRALFIKPQITRSRNLKVGHYRIVHPYSQPPVYSCADIDNALTPASIKLPEIDALARQESPMPRVKRSHFQAGGNPLFAHRLFQAFRTGFPLRGNEFARASSPCRDGAEAG